MHPQLGGWEGVRLETQRTSRNLRRTSGAAPRTRDRLTATGAAGPTNDVAPSLRNTPQQPTGRDHKYLSITLQSVHPDEPTPQLAVACRCCAGYADGGESRHVHLATATPPGTMSPARRHRVYIGINGSFATSCSTPGISLLTDVSSSVIAPQPGGPQHTRFRTACRPLMRVISA